jgi:hypothetical protein
LGANALLALRTSDGNNFSLSSNTGLPPVQEGNKDEAIEETKEMVLYGICY